VERVKPLSDLSFLYSTLMFIVPVRTCAGSTLFRDLSCIVFSNTAHHTSSCLCFVCYRIYCVSVVKFHATCSGC